MSNTMIYVLCAAAALIVCIVLFSIKPKTRTVGSDKVARPIPQGLGLFIEGELVRHNKVGAIKYYSEETGVSLIAAKVAVDAIEAKMIKAGA